MAGRLTEPEIITDYSQRMACRLPPGLYFDDERWQQICSRYKQKRETLTSVDLLQMYPDEEVLQNIAPDEQTLADLVPEAVNQAIDKRS